MNAMLLTAGVGRRMFPLTIDRPKPAIPVLGRPLVMQKLHGMGLRGLDEVVVNLHYLPEVIRELLGDGKVPGLPTVRFSHEPTLLGTAGGVRQAAPMLRGAGPIVVSNSDFLSNIDPGAVLEAHRASGCLATLVLAPWRPGYSVVRRDGAARVRSLAGQPRVDPSETDGKWLFTGCQIIEEELIDRIPPDGPSCLVRDVYRPLAAEGKIGSAVHDGFWWEFGSPEQYLDGCLELIGLDPETRALVASDHDPVRPLDGADAAVGPGADWAESARFVGQVALGFSCYVSEEARLENSVVMPEAWIGPRCRLRRSVVAQGVELPAGFIGEDELVCVDPAPSLDLPPSTRRQDGLLIYSFRTADVE